jgi:uncharacterized protein (TIGR02147 family)
MDMVTKLPTVYDYTDSRKFLADYQQAREKQDRSFSKGAICKMLGIPNTRNYFSEVINGERIVSADYIERFIRVLDLKKEEAQFFRVLVKYTQAENNDEKELYLEQLISLHKTLATPIDKKAFAFFREWHHSVIRALLDVMDFKDDYKELGRVLYPRISLLKVKESLQLLESLGLIKKDEQGFWRPSNKSISTSDYLKDELIFNYQIQCLDLAKQALLKRHRDIPRNVSTNIISVSKDGYEKINKKIEQFRSEIRSIVHKDSSPSEFVYQMNIQFFPSAKVKRGNNAQ